MFKKSERLSRSEFSAYFKTGKRHHFPHLTIITYPLSNRKVSVVVGKKVAKSAVRRNIIKRKVNAVLRSVLTENNFQGVLIVVLKPAFSSLSRKVAEDIVRESIAQVLKSA